MFHYTAALLWLQYYPSNNSCHSPVATQNYMELQQWMLLRKYEHKNNYYYYYYYYYNVKSPCLTKNHVMKTYLGNGGITPLIFDLGTRWNKWSASRPDRFTSRGRVPVTHFIGGWVGPRDRLSAKNVLIMSAVQCCYMSC